jgi:hypothetical protein
MSLLRSQFMKGILSAVRELWREIIGEIVEEFIGGVI